MKKIIDLNSALLMFQEAAIKHAEATEKGDYKLGNKNYAVIAKIISFLKEQNKLEVLSELLNHDSVGVRMWAATFLLPFHEKEGLQVLNKIASESGILSFTAKTTVSEWEKGNLKL